ncbi:hypothetical protein ABKN59_011129 [Abortiporus biennis]
MFIVFGVIKLLKTACSTDLGRAHIFAIVSMIFRRMRMRMSATRTAHHSFLIRTVSLSIIFVFMTAPSIVECIEGTVHQRYRRTKQDEGIVIRRA